MLDSIAYWFGAGERAKYEREALSTANWFLGGQLPSGREFPDLVAAPRYPFVSHFLVASRGVYKDSTEAGFHLAHQLLVGALEGLPSSDLGRLRLGIQASKYEGPLAETFLAFTSLTEIAIDQQSAGNLTRTLPAAVVVSRLVRKSVGEDVLRIILEDVVQALAGHSDAVARRNDRIMQRLIEGLGLEKTLEQLRSTSSRGSTDSP
jgi:hypothetical protein